MNALNLMFIITGMLYGIFVDGTFWKMYFGLVGIYTIVAVMTRNRKENNKRKNIMISTWSESADPTSYITSELVMDGCVEYCKKINAE